MTENHNIEPSDQSLMPGQLFFYHPGREPVILPSAALIRACQELDKLRKLRELRKAIEEVTK